MLGINRGAQNIALQPVQGFFLSAWKNCRHSSMRDDDATPLVERLTKAVFSSGDDSREHLFGYFRYASVDYEAATDQLSSDTVLSLYSSLEKALSDLSQDLFHDYREVLYGLRMTLASMSANYNLYPRVEKRKLDKEEQKDKKLVQENTLLGDFVSLGIDKSPMGHLMSFFSLCVINLSLLFHTMEIMKETFSKVPNDSLIHVGWGDEKIYMRKDNYFSVLKRSIHNAVVNGDDKLFLTDEYFFRLWQDQANSIGLIPSRGKNYVSRDFCMINSQTFNIVKTHDGLRVVPFSYLNQRFLTNTPEEDPDTPDALVQGVNQMIGRSPWLSPWIPTIMKLHLKSIGMPQGLIQVGNRKFFPNWYLPRHLGGFGLTIPPGVDPKISLDQRRMASHFLSNPYLAYYVSVREGKGIFKTDKFLDQTFKTFIGDMKMEPVVDTVRNDGLEEVSSQWSALLQSMNYAMYPSDYLSLKKSGVVYALVRSSGFRKLKPMTDEKIELLRSVRYVSRPTIDPPELPVRHIPILKGIRDEPYSDRGSGVIRVPQWPRSLLDKLENVRRMNVALSLEEESENIGPDEIAMADLWMTQYMAASMQSDFPYLYYPKKSPGWRLNQFAGSVLYPMMKNLGQTLKFQSLKEEEGEDVMV